MEPAQREANPLPPSGPQGIGASKLLIGEGVDECYFFRAMLDHLGIRDVTVEQYGGKNNLGHYLAALIRRPEFPKLASLGITRDADANPHGAFQSVCGSLKMHGLGVPSDPDGSAGARPRVCVYVMPGGGQPGMLEDLCMASVGNDAAIPCVDRYLDCLRTANRQPEPVIKARIRAWLASLPRPDLELGQAAAAGHWPWESPAFAGLIDFLRNL